MKIRHQDILERMSHLVFPSDFFVLENYAHADLFKKKFPVWDTLKEISSYLEKRKLGNIEVEIPSSAYLLHPHLISIGKGTVVEPGAYIQGPCIIGPYCQIRHGAYIRGNVIVGQKCVIGHDTEVKNSIFLDGAQAAHFNYVGDSILGNGVNLGAGAKLANFKLNHSLIDVCIEGKRIQTGLKKMGAIVGDGAQLGCNCVTSPGTLIGRDAFISPCVHVRGYVPNGGRFKNDSGN